MVIIYMFYGIGMMENKLIGLVHLKMEKKSVKNIYGIGEEILILRQNLKMNLGKKVIGDILK